MKKSIAIFLLLSCTSPGRAKTTLEDEGFTSIRMTGYSMSCSDSDDTCTGFTAISANGRHVKGAVGCGFNTGCSKGCTVRID